MSARFNQILIIDSLPAAERGPVECLAADMALWAQVDGEAPAIVRRPVGSAQGLLDLLDECANLARREPYVPLLHIECHGHGAGLEFADGSTLLWTDLKPKLVALNVATKLNLVVVVAACFGGDIARIAGADDRAPFWAFIGPKEQIGAGPLADSMSVFYERLITTKSSQLAMEALRASEAGSKFWNLSVATIFQLIEDGYERDYLSDEAVSIRARLLRALAAQQGVTWPQDEVERMIRDPRYMERFRDRFFMIDLYPVHRQRFAAAA